jgi:hypothetical protein
MLLARLARVFLAVALLAAWQAALQHPIEHVDELGKLVHLHDAPSHQGSPLCDLLDSLTACAPHAPLLSVAAEAFAHLASSTTHGAPRVAEAPPFFSQGPPASV